MPVCLQPRCCDHRQFGDFHIAQTESRRLDLSAAFAGSPASQIDAAAAAVLMLGPVWAHNFFSRFFFSGWEFVLSTQRRSFSVSFAECREARLFVFASICQKIAPNQILLFSMLEETSESWAMFQNFITVFLVKVSRIPVTVTLTVPLSLDSNLKQTCQNLTNRQLIDAAPMRRRNLSGMTGVKGRPA